MCPTYGSSSSGLPSPLPHPVPEVSQQLTVTYCPHLSPSAPPTFPYPSSYTSLYTSPFPLHMAILSYLLCRQFPFSAPSLSFLRSLPFDSLSSSLPLFITWTVPSLELSWSHLFWSPLFSSQSTLFLISPLSPFICFKSYALSPEMLATGPVNFYRYGYDNWVSPRQDTTYTSKGRDRKWKEWTDAWVAVLVYSKIIQQQIHPQNTMIN